MRTLSQLGAVLKKSFLIKSKTPISSLVEIFMPVILLFLFTRIDDKRLVENSFRPFLCLIYSTSMGGLVSNVVTEREQRISEMMKILGLPNWIFYSSWFIFYAIMLAVPSLLVSLVMLYSDVAPDGNVLTVFIYYLLYSVSSIAFSLFLSAPFDSAKVAQTVGFLVYGMVSIIGAFIKPDWSKGTKLLVTFFLPPLGFSLGYQSADPRGMTWDNISIEKDSFSVSDAMLMMFLSTIFFMLCYVYFDQVLPHEVGFRRPWHFPFECLMRSSIKSSSSSHAASNDEHDELVGSGGDQTALSSGTVETKGLSKRYNASRQALMDVNLKLKSGELTVLLGRNGAGKTTLINILTGMTEPSSGTARVFGHSVHGELDKVRENTGFCPQHDIQWAKLTVKEHFEIFGAFRDLPAAVIRERMNRLLASIGLKDKENSPVSQLSGGMKRKLSVALAFLGDSKFVILDEPTSGLDPLSRRHMWTVLGKMREDRVVLLSTHYMDEAEVLGERVVILSDGQVRANGSVNELKREFDCGYELVFELSKSSPSSIAFNMSSFEKVVKQTVSSAKFSHPANDVFATIILPVDAAEFIPDLLADIRAKFGAETFKSGIQIKSKRLEEVFMAIALDGEVEEIVIPPEYEPEAVEGGGNVRNSGVVEYVEGGVFGLLLSQIVGTVIKRFRLFIREIRPSIMQNLFPLLMIVLGIVTVKLTRKEDLSADDAKNKPEKWIENFLSDMAMVTFIQFAFTSISSGIVANLARETQTQSKFLQYVAGLMPLAYWLGSFLADVLEYFVLPFSYTSISLAALNLSIQISPFLALLACFGLGVVAQTYAISVLITNPVMSKFFSYFVSLFLGLVLPLVFFYLRVLRKIETILPILETICRIFPSFNLGEGFLSVNIYAVAQILSSKMTKKAWKDVVEMFPGAANAKSVYDYSACGAAIIWMIGMTPVLFAIAVFVDDLRYKNKTTFSSTFAPPPEPVGFVQDESVARERDKARRSAPGSMAMLVVDVSKQWSSGVVAVNRVPLAVARNGEIFTLLGENGAGKTTLMTMAIGQILPSEGNIFIDRHNTRTELKQARQLIGYCPQFDALLPPLTVKDHLRLFARIKGIKSTSIDTAVDRTIDWLGLGIYQNAKAKSLSGGYKRRLSLAIALMGKPEILILDEPSCGMDPVARRQMWKVMESASRDCALILTTHSMEEAEAVSTRLGIMSRGRMMCLGSATELREKFSNGVEVFVQTKVPSVDPQIVQQTTIGHTSFVALCQRHSQKRASRFVTSGLNIMMKQNSADSTAVATSFAEWWAQETLHDELETLIRSTVVGVSNFEASGRSLRFVVEPSTKILTFEFVSEIFTFLENFKKQGLILDYSVTQNSLDQVFRSIAAREQESAYIGTAILAEAVPLE